MIKFNLAATMKYPRSIKINFMTIHNTTWIGILFQFTELLILIINKANIS